MLPADVLLSFTVASAALALSPGPDNLFVLTQSVQHGKRAGLLITLGLCTGLLLHISMVALGVAAVFQTSATAFSLLKICGALYLFWLAWRALRAGREEAFSPAGQALNGHALYTRGILMNATNPKVAIFFLAFLPQFTSPSQGSVRLQIILLGGVFLLTALVIFSSIALAAGSIGDWLKRAPCAHVIMNRCAGIIFLLLALRLIWVRP